MAITIYAALYYTPPGTNYYNKSRLQVDNDPQITYVTTAGVSTGVFGSVGFYDFTDTVKYSPFGNGYGPKLAPGESDMWRFDLGGTAPGSIASVSISFYYKVYLDPSVPGLCTPNTNNVNINLANLLAGESKTELIYNGTDKIGEWIFLATNAVMP